MDKGPNPTSDLPTILYCHCAHSQIVPAETKTAVLKALCESGRLFVAVADLCERCARGDQTIGALLAGDGGRGGRVRIVACFERAVKWLLDAAGFRANAAALNMRQTPPAEAGAGLLTEEGRQDARTRGQEAGPAEAESSVLPSSSLPTPHTPLPTVVVYEGTGSRPLDAVRRFEVVRTLLERGYGVSVGAGPTSALPISGPAVILGQFAGPSFPEAHISRDSPHLFVDIAVLDGPALVEAVAAACEGLGLPAAGKWLPWFPVIDRSRCTDCRQCHGFCLFGVYEVREGRVVVAHPDKCKAHCPACARVCPAAAIIFPKYPLAPINGDEVRPGDLGAQKMRTDMSALLKGDVYAALRSRSGTAAAGAPSGTSAGATGGAFPNPDEIVRAMEERRKCACKNGQTKPDANASKSQ
ncbi:MAG: hypothetical protein ACE15C_21165 [Phycisphaerae bacterium]